MKRNYKDPLVYQDDKIFYEVINSFQIYTIR